MMKKSKIFQKKVLTICGAMLLVITLVIVYLPQEYLAALLPVQSLEEKKVEKTVHKTEENLEKKLKSAVIDNDELILEEVTPIAEETINVTEDEIIALPKNEDQTAKPAKYDANHEYNEMLIKHDIEGYLKNGKDMSNDPEYQAQLKEIYSEDDLKRLFAPRRVVTLPNVIGKTEADAVKTMHATGITPRVEYEDGGKNKKEGTVIRQELPGDGRKWNTDASIFIYIQRSNQLINTVPVKNVKEPITKPADNKPKTEQQTTKPSVETPKSAETQTKPVVDSSKPVEPATKSPESNEPIDISVPEASNNDTAQTTDES